MGRATVEWSASPPGKPGGTAPAARMPRLRLDQQMGGLLSVRFLEAGAAGGGPATQLVFAGVLEAGSRPLGCRHLRCRPRWPIRLEVRALARGGLTLEPHRPDLLRAQLARGRCELREQRWSCWASGSDGEEWRVEARPENQGK